jgi:hypothetical protein
LGQARAGGDLAPQVDGESLPELPGVVVPQHRPGVVVALRIERRAERRVIIGMP